MKQIEITTEQGYLKAVDEVYKDTLKEYLIMHFRDEVIKSGLWKEISETDSISILKSIQIKKEFQNKGFGSKIMKDYLSQVSSDLIFLIADESRSGKTLPCFYNKFGFEIVIDELHPIMTKKNLG